MTGTAQFPAVASLATIAGPADSAQVVIGLSLPNNVLRFQRDRAGFFAEYRLDVTFMDSDSVTVKRFDTREIVRVSTFAETGRTDESVIFQQGIVVQPGRYIVRFQAADANSSRGFSATDTLDVPDYSGRPGAASPVLVHEAAGRMRRGSMPVLILNPRHTVPYGDAPPRIYVEAYNTDARSLDVRVVGDDGIALWDMQAPLDSGSSELRYGVIEIPSGVLPLGRFWIEIAGPGMSPVRAPLLLTISDAWMVENISELIGFLGHIANEEELDSLRAASAAERRQAWDRFWARRDPLAATSINEYRDQFFQRVRYATEAFREGDRPGWDTDRGAVHIALGPPDQVRPRAIGDGDVTGKPNAEDWIYDSTPVGGVTLTFHDATGFDRYDLTPSSADEFAAITERLRPRPQRN